MAQTAYKQYSNAKSKASFLHGVYVHKLLHFMLGNYVYVLSVQRPKGCVVMKNKKTLALCDFCVSATNISSLTIR